MLAIRNNNAAANFAFKANIMAWNKRVGVPSDEKTM